MPATLLRTMVRMRIESINASFPKRSGESKEFFANGRLKSSGRIKDGELHGTWQWFSKDGTLTRTATYRNGSRVSLP
jgi:antitoxin component YwqK of YwqJK toxin-antitoxin module